MSVANKLKTLCMGAIFLLVFMLALSAIAQFVQAQGAGVGVFNVPPEYKQAEIVSNGSVVEVRLVVTDYNSWQDIQEVRVDVRAGEDITAAFVYKQYADEEAKIRVDEFRNIIGSALVPERCKVVRATSEGTVLARCCMKLVFTLTPTTGNSIAIYITDSSREEASTFVQYGATGGLPAPPGTFLIPGLNIAILTTHESAECFVLAISATVTVILIIRKWFGW